MGVKSALNVGGDDIEDESRNERGYEVSRLEKRLQGEDRKGGVDVEEGCLESADGTTAASATFEGSNFVTNRPILLCLSLGHDGGPPSLSLGPGKVCTLWPSSHFSTSFLTTPPIFPSLPARSIAHGFEEDDPVEVVVEAVDEEKLFWVEKVMLGVVDDD